MLRKKIKKNKDIKLILQTTHMKKAKMKIDKVLKLVHMKIKSISQQ